MTDAITIALATADDARDVWLWRNDAQTRAMSLSTDEVSWATHQAWYEKSLDDPNRFLYIGRLAATEKVGMCRFDIGADGRSADVSINLNPGMRGRNLARRLLAGAIAVFRGTRPIALVATIKRHNAASIRCFSQCGFMPAAEDHEHIYYRLEPS